MSSCNISDGILNKFVSSGNGEECRQRNATLLQQEGGGCAHQGDTPYLGPDHQEV